MLSFAAAAVVLLGVVGAPAAAAPGATVTSQSVTTIDGTAYVWQSSQTDIRVQTDRPLPSSSSVCVGSADGNRTVTCVPANGATNLTISVQNWPEGVTGAQTVFVNGTDGQRTLVESAVFVMTEDGDVDGDGLSNAEEVSGETEFKNADTDDDGLDDGAEVNTHGTDPTSADTDGDGLDDTAEIRTYETNPTKSDTDGDGLADGPEINQYSTSPSEADSDGDGLDDGEEVNTYGTNPNKADTDGDGLSDGEEINTYETNPNKADTDEDNLDDAAEVQTYETNPNKADTDGDGLNDGAEVNVHGTDPNSADTDEDGTSDRVEVENGSDPGEAPEPEAPVSSGAGIALVGTAVLAAGGGYLWWRRRGGGASATESDDGDGSGGAAAVTADSSTGSETPEAGVESGVEPAGAEVPNGAEPAADRGEPEQYDEPLTREDEVIAILETAGGRLEQSAIVSETGWSKATVSRVLSSMADEGRITKISLGRRNLITLPGNEPDGARSPFEKPS
ncbi:IclR-like transcriptional regulator [Halogeometricum sp. S3BR5-2]|uniref:IclR-like transcriptional regulator n=1 Tax=Halogeometricum luteum TaxID=2950537 RepID=A0ABU2G2S8_9EURY|nr:binary toxin-like calcium binding domain-containing protein [Halogeometricum sp. S3BR5-2]MDS0295083.1 IclR-like transcriptional regulator [Halogeometricum sp. S3BR5-2]